MFESNQQLQQYNLLRSNAPQQQQQQCDISPQRSIIGGQHHSAQQQQEHPFMSRATTPPRMIVRPSAREFAALNTHQYHMPPEDVGGHSSAMSLNDAPSMELDINQYHHYHQQGKNMYNQQLQQQQHSYQANYYQGMHNSQFSPPRYPTSTQPQLQNSYPPMQQQQQQQQSWFSSPTASMVPRSPYSSPQHAQCNSQPVTPPQNNNSGQPQYTYSPVVEFDEEPQTQHVGNRFPVKRRLFFDGDNGSGHGDAFFSSSQAQAQISSSPISPPRIHASKFQPDNQHPIGNSLTSWSTQISPARSPSQFQLSLPPGSPPRAKSHHRHGSIGDNLNDSPASSNSEHAHYSLLSHPTNGRNSNSENNHMTSPRTSLSSLFSLLGVAPGSDKHSNSPPRQNHKGSSSLFDRPIDVLVSPGREPKQHDTNQENQNSNDKIASSVPEESDNLSNTMPFPGVHNGMASFRQRENSRASFNSSWTRDVFHQGLEMPQNWTMNPDFQQQQQQQQAPRMISTMSQHAKGAWFEELVQNQGTPPHISPPRSEHSTRPNFLSRSNSQGSGSHSKISHQSPKNRNFNSKERHAEPSKGRYDYRRPHASTTQHQKQNTSQSHYQQYQQKLLEKGESTECKSLRKQMKALEKEGYESVKKFARTQLSSLQSQSHWRIFMDLADMAKRSNNVDEARRCFREVHRLEPNAPQAWLEHAKLEEENAELDECERLLELGLSVPACRYNENLIIKYIKYQEQKDQIPMARNMLARMKQIPIEKGWKTILEGAMLESRVGNIALSRSIFKFLMAQVPKHGPIFFEAYRFEETLEEYERALRIIKNGLKENARYGPLWFAQFHVLEKLAHRNAQLSCTENVKDQNDHMTSSRPKPPSHCINLTKARNCIIESLEASNISKELHWKVHFEHAQIEERAGNIDEAREALAKSIKDAMPNLRWKVWLAGARLELNMGRIQVARDILTLAMDEVPIKSKAVVLLERARLEEYAGDIDMAREFLNDAKKEARHEWKVFLEAILLEMRAGDINRAILEAEKALEVHRGTGRLWAMLIQLKHMEGEEEQYRIFKKAVDKVPKSGEVWCEGARILLNPLSSRFHLAEAKRCITFAMRFTPQYGDSLIEYLRLGLLTNGPQTSDEEKKYLEHLCMNADPNYGPLWVHCKRDPLDSTHQVLKRALDMLKLELMQHRHIYQHAIMRSEQHPTTILAQPSYHHKSSSSISSISSSDASTMSSSDHEDGAVHVGEDDFENSNEVSEPGQHDTSFESNSSVAMTSETSSDSPNEQQSNTSSLTRSNFMFGLQSYSAVIGSTDSLPSSMRKSSDKTDPTKLSPLRFRYIFSDLIM